MNWAGKAFIPGKTIPFSARQSRSSLPAYSLITLLLTSLATLALYGFLSLFSVAYSQLLAVIVALLLFALVHPWLEMKLEQRLHPEQQAYHQLMAAYSQLVQETPHLSGMLPYVSRTLCADLAAPGATVWLYQPEDGLLTLAHREGMSDGEELSEVPVDLDLKYLRGTQPVQALPESALRQGWLAMHIEVVTSLRLREELVGVIGLGGYPAGHKYQPETLHVLDLLAGQLALVVKNGRLITDLEATLGQLQQAYRRTLDSQEEERRKLAVELHDDILSRLTTMGMTLRNSQRQLNTDTAKVQLWLEMLEQETRYLNIRLREITQGLHPAILADLGLIAALQAYMDTLTKHALPASAPRTIDLTAQGFDTVRIPDRKLERDLYYLTRQALDNALKHAAAEQILIHLRWRDEAVTVTVQDNGVGLKSAPEHLMGQQGHLGLLSMHERVLAWRGRLSFQSNPGQGTTVYARLPISQPSSNPSHLQAFTCYLRGGIGN